VDRLPDEVWNLKQAALIAPQLVLEDCRQRGCRQRGSARLPTCQSSSVGSSVQIGPEGIGE
jgi:hypothetical protein